MDELNIIIVDDSEFSRRHIASVLSEAGANIQGEASCAQEAFEMLNNYTPDLMVIDVVMPDVSGIDLAKHINENFSAIHVIMVSSLGQESIIIESIAAGAFDFLQKPFSKQQLIDAVEKAAQVMKEK